MIFCRELKKEFATKEEMFAAIKANKEGIIGLKKGIEKRSDPIKVTLKAENAEKDANSSGSVKIGDTIYPIINTTMFYDSHGDVHLNGIWDVSVKDQADKLYYIINHDLEIGKVISYPKDTRAYVVDTTFKALGLPYDGSTQALTFAVKLTDKTNKDFLTAVMDKEDLQNSVRMRYISYQLCVNSDDPEMATEKANFWKYFPDIANKDDVLNDGYFWAVQQAAIVKEGSAVLFGSNEATPIQYEDPANAGQKEQQNPHSDSSTVKSTKSYINLI